MAAEDRLTRVDGAERRAAVTQAQRAVVQLPRVAVAIVTTVAEVTQRRRRERKPRSFACMRAYQRTFAGEVLFVQSKSDYGYGSVRERENLLGLG